MISSVSVNVAGCLQQNIKRADAPKSAEPSAAEGKLSPKAAAIAKQIAAGEYKIDLAATAKAMASELA